MAKRKDKEKAQAIQMRLHGASYSQIKKKINVSKSSLSYWLRDYPLSEKRIRELRDKNPRRIERFRNTMQKKRETRQKKEYERAKKDIGKLSKRDLFVAGLFLYLGEGSKGDDTTVSLSNTDVEIIKIFTQWLVLLGVTKNNLKVRLHLYSDMNIHKEQMWWSKKLKIPLKQFRVPYIKKSKRSDITWKHPSQHGTCNILYGSRPLKDYVLMAIEYVRIGNTRP